MKTWRETLGDLASKLHKRQEERANSYRELLEMIDGGKTVNLDDVERILEAAGKSPADMEADLQLMEQRRVWAADLAEQQRWQTQLEAGYREQESIKADEEAAYRRLREEFGSRKVAAVDSIREASTGISKAQTARNKLQETHSKWRQLLETQRRLAEPLLQNQYPLDGDIQKAQSRVSAIEAELAAMWPNDNRRSITTIQLNEAKHDLQCLVNKRDRNLAAAKAAEAEFQQIEAEMAVA